MYELVDTHAHLDELEDISQALETAHECGVVKIIAVGMDYESNCRVLEIAGDHESLVLPALGYHPDGLGATAAEIERNLLFIRDNIDMAIGIGEIGLDYHKKVLARTSKDAQKQVLRDILSIAKEFRKPALLHSRYAWRDTYNILHESGVEKAVFHWYTGPLTVLHDFVGEGHFASATLAVEYHDEHRKAIRETPDENIMLETDSPVIYRWGTEHARKSQPADVARVLEAVALLRGMDTAEVARLTTDNARRFFGLTQEVR